MDSNFSVKITADISELQARLASVEAITGKFSQSMDKAAGAVKNMEQNANRGRMVAFAFGQVIRDSGFFANSFSLGILAISNNIPILIDQLSLSVKALQPFAGILSMVGSLLTAGLTIWAYSTQAVKENRQSIDEWRASLEDATEIQLKGKQAALEESASLDILYRAATNAANSNRTRTQAAKELQELYPSIFGNLDTEAIKLGKAKTSYDELKKAIVETAMAEAAKDKIVENSSRILDNQTRVRETRSKRIKQDLELAALEARASAEFERASRAALTTPGKEGINVFAEYERIQSLITAKTKEKAEADQIIYDSTTDTNILNQRNEQLLGQIDKYTKSYVESLKEGNTELDKTKRQTVSWKLYAKDTASEFRNIFEPIKGKEVKQFELFPSNLGTHEKEQLKGFVLATQETERQINDIFVNGIVATIGNSMMAIGEAFAMGGNVAAAFGTAILGSLSSVLSQLADKLIAAGIAGLTFSNAMKNLFDPKNWALALAAGVALKVAAGAAGGFARKLSGGGASGMTSGSGASPTPSFGRINTFSVNTGMTASSSIASTINAQPVLETRVSGNDLVILMNRSSNTRNSYY